jgi:hypothetical protein
MYKTPFRSTPFQSLIWIDSNEPPYLCEQGMGLRLLALTLNRIRYAESLRFFPVLHTRDSPAFSRKHLEIPKDFSSNR